MTAAENNIHILLIEAAPRYWNVSGLNNDRAFEISSSILYEKSPNHQFGYIAFRKQMFSIISRLHTFGSEGLRYFGHIRRTKAFVQTTKAAPASLHSGEYEQTQEAMTGIHAAASQLISTSQEYVNILQVDPTKRKVPSRARRGALICLHVFVPYLLDKMLVQLEHELQAETVRPRAPQTRDWTLTSFFRERAQWALGRLTETQRRTLLHGTYVLRQGVTFAHRLHVALFYINGAFYHLGKRVSGISYLRVRGLPGDDRAVRTSYKLLGAVSLLQLALTVALQINNFRQRQRARQEWKQYRNLASSGSSSLDPLAARTSRCVLCLEERRHSTATPCGHLFCWECIIEWCNTKGTGGSKTPKKPYQDNVRNASCIRVRQNAGRQRLEGFTSATRFCESDAESRWEQQSNLQYSPCKLKLDSIKCKSTSSAIASDLILKQRNLNSRAEMPLHYPQGTGGSKTPKKPYQDKSDAVVEALVHVEAAQDKEECTKTTDLGPRLHGKQSEKKGLYSLDSDDVQKLPCPQSL
ncbi:UNVERIFIED_CONTAM: hypothetical protein FKN15_022843 [Acipenser sinensis]